MQPTLKTQVKQWLLDRGISEEIIKTSGLQWDEKHSRIIIPVFDVDGNRIFNKYRKNPFEESPAPKYKYDFGAGLALYNINKITGDIVFILEGELDAVLLNSLGCTAVSSTGGAGTFKQEWADLLSDKTIYICLDNDNAGMKGSIRLQRMLPKAKWIFLPESHGKDVTEFIKNKGVKAFKDLTESARSYKIPEELPVKILEKKEINDKIQEFKSAANEIVLLQRTDGSHQLEFLRKYLIDRYGYYVGMRNRFGTQRTIQSLDEIKRIPITELVAFNRDGFANCIFHKEKTPSMKYNGPNSNYPNTAHCFSCAKTWDVISIYMQLHNVQFKEAVKQLKK